jgi:excisionase family DNA binding protein
LAIPEGALVVTAAEVAAAYRVPRDTIYELCHQNLIPHFRFGRTIRIDRCMVDDPETMRRALACFSGPRPARTSLRPPRPWRRHPTRRPPGALAIPFDFTIKRK